MGNGIEGRSGVHTRLAPRTGATMAGWAVLAAIGAGPLAGQIDPTIGPLIIPAIALGGVAVVAGPSISEDLPWRWLLLATFLLAAAWAVALASAEGWHAVSAPLATRYDYLHDVPLVGASPGPFLSTFTDRIAGYSIHVQGHPPGMILLLWTLDRLGLGGAGWATAIVVAGGAAAAPAAMVAARDLAGESAARGAAPFLALAPAAVWIATSGDALFAGVGAWGVALVVLASGRTGRSGDAHALAGGLLLGSALFLTYGAVLLGCLVLAVALFRRKVRPLVIGGGAVLVVVAAFAAAGFWWAAGLRATLGQYTEANAGLGRDYLPFLLSNVAVIAIALGPAVVVALARLRHRGVWILAGAALAAIAVADLSGLSRGEVERIWLPFVPWIVLATCALAGSIWERRAWLAIHACAAIAVQAVFRTPW
jgi:hypothetical protein